MLLLTWFKGCIDFEKVHPLEGGALHFKFRRDRRPALAILPAWRFYPSYFAETVMKVGRWIGLYVRLRLMYQRVKSDARRFDYSDLAVTAMMDDEIETRELFRTPAAQAYVAMSR